MIAPQGFVVSLTRAIGRFVQRRKAPAKQA